eukprot:6176707-Pleurochrysis_carterae.AAC.2
MRRRTAYSAASCDQSTDGSDGSADGSTRYFDFLVDISRCTLLKLACAHACIRGRTLALVHGHASVSSRLKSLAGAWCRHAFVEFWAAATRF